MAEYMDIDELGCPYCRDGVRTDHKGGHYDCCSCEGTGYNPPLDCDTCGSPLRSGDDTQADTATGKYYCDVECLQYEAPVDIVSVVTYQGAIIFACQNYDKAMDMIADHSLLVKGSLIDYEIERLPVHK